MTDPAPACEPQWCPSIYRGAACLMAPGDKHAGSNLDGKWLRWTDADVVDEALTGVERSLGMRDD